MYVTNEADVRKVIDMVRGLSPRGFKVLEVRVGLESFIMEEEVTNNLEEYLRDCLERRFIPWVCILGGYKYGL